MQKGVQRHPASISRDILPSLRRDTLPSQVRDILPQTVSSPGCLPTLVGEVDASDINAWFAHMRKSPGGHGKPRSERTIQTHARSARVERLLLACAPPNETGPFAERAAVRNRAILWVLYDTGIRVSELCGLRLADFDRKHGILTVTGKGSKERRVALGNNCLRNLLYYLDKHRPDGEELAEWGSTGEDHLFLSETRLPLTKNGVTLLFKRIRQRAGVTDVQYIVSIPTSG